MWFKDLGGGGGVSLGFKVQGLGGLGFMGSRVYVG